MKRLIDADAVKKENERLLHCDFPYLSETTLEELIDEAPTIDAIPISFIEEQVKLCNEIGFSRGEECYVALIEKWRKEHAETD